MLRFGEVLIDLEARETRLAGEVRHLEPEAFDLLGYLVAVPTGVVAMVAGRSQRTEMRPTGVR